MNGKKGSHHPSRPGPLPVSVSLDSKEGKWTSNESVGASSYMNRRVFYLSLQAIFNAIIIGLIAKVLMLLIYLITNLSFYGKFSFESAAPGIGQLGILVILIPVIGGIIVGIIARYGSAGIRGHGIPEAMEQVLSNKSRISPIITILKPLASAIAIGTGGPFGAEGPAIATGGAFGSLTGQIMRINATERKIILASGACAGMAAIFGSPIASIMMGIELLLFEFSPRSIIPVTLSCATAAALHYLLFGSSPIFEMATLPIPTSKEIITYTIIGVPIGVAAAFVSKSVYFFEDMYAKLHIHWMWWPAIGGIFIGVIGYFAPKTMGVGYSNIDLLLSGNAPLKLLFAFCILKFLSWSVSLGSGTAGGTLAPLFTIGGGMGALLGVLALFLFPHLGINVATAGLIGMAALFAGASGALLTSIIFVLETTGQFHDLLPVVGAASVAYFISFILMKGSSIMTIEIKRRGVMVPGTFEPDLLMSLTVEDTMIKNLHLTPEHSTIGACKVTLLKADEEIPCLIIVDKNNAFQGLVNSHDIVKAPKDKTSSEIRTLIKPESREAFAFPDTSLQTATEIMNNYKVSNLPIISHKEKQTVVGILNDSAILSAYNKRRTDDMEYLQAISLKRQGLSALLRERKLHKNKS